MTDEIAPPWDDGKEPSPEEAQNESTANFEEKHAVVSKLTDEDRRRMATDSDHINDEMRSTLSTLSTFFTEIKNIEHILENGKITQFVGDLDHIAKYAKIIQEAYRTAVPSHYDVSPFKDPESFWRQSVEHDGAEIGLNKPRFSSKGGKLTGDAAIHRISQASGLGIVVNVPLWHTGIWVKIETPTASAQLELERLIQREKGKLGRSTNGVAYSNTSVYSMQPVLDFIFNHVVDTTAPSNSPAYLKALIKVTDIPQLIWGMTCAIWPDGYRLSRPCVANPEECTHVDEAHVNLTKLSWTDNRALSQTQKHHMSFRDRDATEEQLERYYAEHKRPQTRTVKINDTLSMVFATPTIEEYLESGARWIEAIKERCDGVFARNMSRDERDLYLLEQARATRLRRYTHWVKSIVIHNLDDPDEDAIVEDLESIERSLVRLSTEKEMRVKINDSVEALIRDSSLNAIGIPKYVCPKCKKDPHPDTVHPQLKEIIQLEMLEVFFILTSTRINDLLESTRVGA